MYPVFVHVLAGQGVCGVNKICAEPSRLDGGGGSLRENSWVGHMASMLGSKYLCRAIRARVALYLCLGGRGGKWHLPASLFLDRFPNTFQIL